MSTLEMAKLSAVMRRDQAQPLRFFRRTRIVHYYRTAPYDDLVSDEYHADLIQFHSPRDLYHRLRGRSFDIIQNVEPFDLVLLPYFMIAAHAAAVSRTPMLVVTMENRPLVDKFTRPVAFLIRTILRPKLLQARGIIYVNRGARQNLIYCGAPLQKAVHLMYGTWGVDVGEFSPVGSAAVLPLTVSLQLLFVGRLAKEKGLFDLLDAVLLLARQGLDVGLTVIGSGQDQDEAKQFVVQNDIDSRVAFLGAVKNQQIPAYLRAADILVAPSQTSRMWEEQVGMVNLQAMACGTPLVSTISGAIPEFVEDRKTGLLVPQVDVSALVQAIYELATNLDLRQSLAINGRQKVLESYDANKNILLVEDYIHQLLETD